MARGKRRAEWEHTSWVVAMLACTGSQRFERTFNPPKFNPIEQAEQSTRTATPHDLAMLKAACEQFPKRR